MNVSYRCKFFRRARWFGYRRIEFLGIRQLYLGPIRIEWTA